MQYIAAIVKGFFSTQKKTIECSYYKISNGKLTCYDKNEKIVARFRLTNTKYQVFTNSVDAEQWLYKQS